MESWTVEEVVFLQKNYTGLTIKEIATKLNRSRYSVGRRMKKEGFHRPPLLRSDSRILEASDIEVAWLVGIIEGEGTLTISRMSKTHEWYVPMILIDNTDIDIIKGARAILGGVTQTKRAPSKTTNGWKTQYRLWLKGIGNVKPALERIRPYIRSSRKRQIAGLLLEFCDVSMQTYRWHKIPEESMQKKREIVAKVRALNRKKREVVNTP